MWVCWTISPTPWGKQIDLTNSLEKKYWDWGSLCTLGCSTTCSVYQADFDSPASLCLPSVGLKGVHHHHQEYRNTKLKFFKKFEEAKHSGAHFKYQHLRGWGSFGLEVSVVYIPVPEQPRLLRTPPLQKRGSISNSSLTNFYMNYFPLSIHEALGSVPIIKLNLKTDTN